MFRQQQMNRHLDWSAHSDAQTFGPQLEGCSACSPGSSPAWARFIRRRFHNVTSRTNSSSSVRSGDSQRPL